MAAHLCSLLAQTIQTMTGAPNAILRVDGNRVLVGTRRSPAGAWVDIDEIQDAADRLYAVGSIDISVASVGHRSAFVGAVLLTLPGAKGERPPRRITIDRGAAWRNDEA